MKKTVLFTILALILTLGIVSFAVAHHHSGDVYTHHGNQYSMP